MSKFHGAPKISLNLVGLKFFRMVALLIALPGFWKSFDDVRWTDGTTAKFAKANWSWERVRGRESWENVQYLVGLAMDSLNRQAQWQPFGHWKVKGNFLYRPLFIWETHNGSCGWSHLHHFSGPQRRVSIGNALKQSRASDFKFRTVEWVENS